MTRERVPCLLSGLVLLAVLLILVRGMANVIVRGVDDFFSCSEYIRKEIASSGGQYIAQVVVEGCGGAAGQISVAVRLRSAVEEPDSKGQTVFELGGSYGLSVYWEGEESLLIEHLCGATNVDTQRDRWRKCLDQLPLRGPPKSTPLQRLWHLERSLTLVNRDEELLSAIGGATSRSATAV